MIHNHVHESCVETTVRERGIFKFISYLNFSAKINQTKESNSGLQLDRKGYYWLTTEYRLFDQKLLKVRSRASFRMIMIGHTILHLKCAHRFHD